jgi:TRAP-type C4-dicarboxylate transport system permease small subunit
METPKVSPAMKLVNNLRSLYYSSLPILKKDYLSSMVLRPVSSNKHLEDTPKIPPHTVYPFPPKTQALSAEQVQSVSNEKSVKDDPIIPVHTWYPPKTEQVQSVSNEKSVKDDPIIPVHTWYPPKTATVTSSRRRLQMAHNHDHHDHDHKGPSPPPPPTGPESDSDSDSDSDSEDTPPSKGKTPCPHHLPPDDMFAGAIGFGAEGDLCMYHNLDVLSPTCQQAVADLYQLRQQFWIEDASAQAPPPPPHHHPFLLLAPVLLLGAALMFKRHRHLKRRREVNHLLESLHSGDANLKKAVEQQAKMSVPVPVPVLPCSTGSFCCRLAKTLLLMVFVLFSSLVIAVSSLEITAAVLSQIQPASSPVAVLVLVSVCTVELALFFVLVKLGKTFCVKHCGADHSPSAPLEQEEDEVNHNGGGGRFLLVRKKIQDLRNFAFHSFRFPSSSSSSSPVSQQYYTPLLQQEETTATEMTTVSPAVVRWQSPVEASQQYTIVPVTANTFNNISMV